LDRLFEEAAMRQCCGELAFSTCAELLSLVVSQTRPSVHAAYRVKAKQIAVSVQSVYNKLAGIEPRVSEALVRETARDLAEIIRGLRAELPGPLPGFDVRIVDGNHLSGTQHRLKELRRLGDAALPGHSLAVLNPHLELIESVLLCEDGHANQKPLLPQLLDRLQSGQCWIADRDFSTLAFLFGIHHRGAYFLVRQHAVLEGELIGSRTCLGRTETGVIFEQALKLKSAGEELVVRRITIELDRLTRDKDTEIHLLTNLPPEVDACQIAHAYQARWNIEVAFARLTTVLRCELNTLGYPDAALFGFCLAVVMYNAVSTVMAALRVAHPQVLEAAGEVKPSLSADRKRATRGRGAASRPKLSFYYLADEIAGVWRGMAIAVPAQDWTAAFAQQTPKQLAKLLLWFARQAHVDQFLTNPYRRQQRRKRRPMTTTGHHISTYRLLQSRKPKSKRTTK
jgi:IS4 transposase